MACRDCKFWHREDVDRYGNTNTDKFGVCLRVLGPSEREEKKDFLGNSILDFYELAFVEDGSGYHAALRTLPDFHCMAFEQKD